MQQIEEFLEEGDRVSAKIVLRGREASLVDFVAAFQQRLLTDIVQKGKIVKGPVNAGKIIQVDVVKGS